MTNDDLFSAIAEDWDRRSFPLPTEKIGHILDIAGIRAGDSVLDAGTGTGVLLPFLSMRQQGRGVLHAIDSSASMLGIAHRKNAGLLPSPVFILADIETDKVYGRFDHIVLYCVFPHLRTPVKTIAGMFYGNLLPGGSITIAHPMSRDAVNGIHENSSVMSCVLEPAETVASRLEKAGVPVSYIEDSDDYYIINALNVHTY